MSKKQVVYSDFSGGYNDSVAHLSIEDNEVCISENVDYSSEVKSFRTRKGCTKVNGTSFDAEITDSHEWSIGSKYKKCLVMGSKLYELNADGTVTEKISLSANKTEIYPFVVYNKFYFGDGAELYVWGDYDYSSELGTVNVAINKIVRNNDSPDGSLGHFYMALNARGSINLTTEDYENLTNWEDVTEVDYFASNVVRPLIAHDPSQAEVVKVSILKGADAAGTITVVLDDVDFTTSVTAGQDVSAILTALNATVTTGWSKKKSGNSITYTKNSVGLVANGYVDPGITGVTVTYETLANGKADDNDLAPIKKCTMFVVHTSSYRVFAAGNPDDNAVFYSEIGQPTYFISAYNKLYSSIGYGATKGMLQLSESVLISYEDGWYAWDGITPLQDAEWKPLNLPYGCASHRSIALTPYSFVFLGKDGIYNVSASILSSELVLLQGENIIKKITDKRLDKTMASIIHPEKCRGVFYDNAYYLAYSVDETGNKYVVKYEWGMDAFSKFTGWHVNTWVKDPDSLYFASKNYFLKTNSGESDIDVETGEEKAIELFVMTKEYSLGDPFMNKLMDLVGLIFKQRDDQDLSSVDVRVVTGYSSFDVESLDVSGHTAYIIDNVNVTASIVDGINISESLIWGRDWGLIWGFRESIIKIIELTAISNTFKVAIRNNRINDPITLIGIGFIYENADYVSVSSLKDEVLLT